MNRIPLTLLVFVGFALGFGCESGGTRHADDEDTVADASVALPDATQGWPDDPVVPTAVTDPEETGSEPCRFDADHWFCRLNVEGPGYLIVDLGDGIRGYSRSLRASLRGPSLLDEHGATLLALDEAGGLALVPPLDVLEPRATTVVHMAMNLDARASAPVNRLSPSDPDSYNYTTQMTVFDSLGVSHEIALYFSSDGSGSWSWSALVAAQDLEGGPGDDPIEIGSGTLSFGYDGQLLDDTPQTISTTFPGANSQDIDLDFAGTTQYGAPFSLNSASQDGYSAGWRDGLDVGWDGALTATYTNGQVVKIGTLAVALFASPEELRQIGPHLWIATARSGLPLVDRGVIRGWTLESP